MAKAETESKPAICKDEADRISVNEVFQLLLSKHKPHAARERLDSAICRDEVRVWCTDKGVTVHIKADRFARDFRVTIWELDGRWVASIEGRFFGGGREGAWTMLRAEAEKLVQGVQAKPGGRPREYDHEQILIVAAIVAYTNGLPETLEEFADQVAVAAEARGVRTPERTQLQKILRPLYNGLKDAN
jgi:hypothetical protein